MDKEYKDEQIGDLEGDEGVDPLAFVQEQEEAGAAGKGDDEEELYDYGELSDGDEMEMKSQLTCHQECPCFFATHLDEKTGCQPPCENNVEHCLQVEGSPIGGKDVEELTDPKVTHMKTNEPMSRIGKLEHSKMYMVTIEKQRTFFVDSGIGTPYRFRTNPQKRRC